LTCLLAEGKEVRKLLRNLAELEEALDDPAVKPFLNFLAAYKEVVDSSLGTKLGDFEMAHAYFASALSELMVAFPSVRMTPKWHILCNHVPEVNSAD
jgi:hypothetical protein